MKTQQIRQVSLNGGRAIPQRGWWLGLGAVLVTLLAVISFAGFGMPAATITSSSAATRLEPGAQSVADYLRVHSSIPEHASPDPAVQSVADYLRAHSTDVGVRAQSVPDAPVQSVADYLRAHGTDVSVRAQSVPDAAVQSVLNYIHVHESIPDSVILELYRAHADRKD